jgi:hypothetical protein
MENNEFYFWCFNCKSGCMVYEDNNNDVHCEKCNSTFVEEIEENSQHGGSPQNFIPYTVNTNNRNRNPTMFTSIQITGNNGNFTVSNTNINPFFNFNSVIDNLFSMTGFSPLGSFLQRHNGDMQFENLLNYLMMNDPNRYGNPPASKQVVANLPREKVTDENLEKYKTIECSICFEHFKRDDVAVKIDCGHPYHDKCIEDWLAIHNSCPICRYELVTDDANYEQRKSQNRNILRNYNNN